MRILVTGGAGYVGTRLMTLLLSMGDEVTCYDRLEHGINPIRMHFEHPQFTFVRADIQNTMLLNQYIKRADVIFHLAAIVGYPACDADPVNARNINEHASHAINSIRWKSQRVIFASTGSVYGKVADVTCAEETKLNPTSLYARTKAEAEKGFLDKGNAVALRFSTGYGLSHRMRDDTMVNDFTRRAVKEHRLSVYEPHAMRSFIHVFDMARALVHALDIDDGAYNCAALNVTKLELTQLIRQAGVRFEVELEDQSIDPEHRNYKTECAKIEQTGFRITGSDIIQEIKLMARYYDSAC